MSMMWLNCSSFGGGRTCLGFMTFSIRSAALASTSALSESGNGVFGFFWGLISQGLRGFAIVVAPFDRRWLRHPVHRALRRSQRHSSPDGSHEKLGDGPFILVSPFANSLWAHLDL